MEAYIEGKRISLSPKKSIGKGGEADIYEIGGGMVAKIFKQVDHPDFEGADQEKIAAKVRIREHQEKLKVFPKNLLPDSVIVPENLVYDDSQRLIIGYSMRFVGGEVLLRFSEKSFRQLGIANDEIIAIFSNLYKTVAAVHQARVIIGDFNDLNVLVSGRSAFLIDADSMQFGKFLCRTFTERFVDPLLCDARQKSLVLSKPHTVESDWYAFAVMLMQCLLFVHPYGGIYRQKNAKQVGYMSQAARIFQRITVFHSDVQYPKPAIPYIVLPDDLLQHFHQVFEKDVRGEFPLKLVENIQWTKCSKCQTEHCRNSCPNCLQIAPAAIREVIVVRGKVSATRIFETSGIILFAAIQEKKLRWLYQEQNKFKRESGEVVMSGKPDPLMRFRIFKEATLIGKNGQVVTLHPNKPPERLSVDSFGSLPMFDTNESCRYWLQGGQLFRDGQFGPQFIGEVLSSQTLFWAGSKFGFGFYRAGEIQVGFVFDAKRQGINDSVKLPKFRGQLVDSTCMFGENLCWFFIALQDGRKIINRCVVIERNGNVVAHGEAEQGDGTWLSSLRGKCALGNFLFASTDQGIVRIEIENGKIVETRNFPDTEPFVDSTSNLFVGEEGIYVVGRQEIRRLKLM